ncbi:hypothetical protein AB69_1337 [Escherichia coli 1-110-08_S1_C3]|nr:hypothetical protein AB69_1337 [Escherichia coli 1-110-08_S1_C3]
MSNALNSPKFTDNSVSFSLHTGGATLTMKFISTDCDTSSPPIALAVTKSKSHSVLKQYFIDCFSVYDVPDRIT